MSDFLAGFNSESGDIVLASASPRRRELLTQAGVNFRIQVSHVDEALSSEEKKNPHDAVCTLALRKAQAVAQVLIDQGLSRDTVVIGSDTMVVYQNEIFGKPASEDEAFKTLRTLSGNTHEVLTAVALIRMAPCNSETSPLCVSTDNQSSRSSLDHCVLLDESRVHFRDLSDEEIGAYIRGGEPFGKAGAYAVQGAGKSFVTKIDGSRDTVIGLPVHRLLQEFPNLGGHLM
jgi:septum formation protein